MPSPEESVILKLYEQLGILILLEYIVRGDGYLGLLNMVPAPHALPDRIRVFALSTSPGMLVRTHAVSSGRVSVLTLTSKSIVAVEGGDVGLPVLAGLEVGWLVFVGLTVGWLVLAGLEVDWSVLVGLMLG